MYFQLNNNIMKKNQFFKTLIVLFLIFGLISCTDVENGDSFSFVFMTDIHLQPEQQAVEGFRKAISVADSLDVDFIRQVSDQNLS